MTRGGFYEYYAQGYLPSQVHGNPTDPDVRKTREYRLAGKEASLWKAGGFSGLQDDPVGNLQVGSPSQFGRQADSNLFEKFMNQSKIGMNPNAFSGSILPMAGAMTPEMLQ
jgi:hypothetical protein